MKVVWSFVHGGEKTSPLAPLAGSRARGEGRWDGLGGRGRRCRLREKGAFCGRGFSCCDHPSPGPHPRKRGEGESFGSSGWRWRTGFLAPLQGAHFATPLVMSSPGVPLVPRCTPGYCSFAPPGRGEEADGCALGRTHHSESDEYCTGGRVRFGADASLGE
ncbi:hypothetical protein HNQ64_002954 [Prosthecobacter dejongeii]|uniref:Uncharacterized protein n=1 Tax=Prosthecobacter dejongeii TaxID=48465 RepID=A0A7W8DRA1_9BACT|nr:hypothetical protein [Prosthecobacter dejongeii]